MENNFNPQLWLGSAILAASAHNTQPWRCKIGQNSIDIYPDPLHMLGPGDPTHRQTCLGLGAFVENLCIAATASGFSANVSYPEIVFRTDKPLITILFSADSTETSELYLAISRRHTNRGMYREEPLSEEVTTAMQTCPLEPGVHASFITEAETKAQIGGLINRGLGIGLNMNALRQELSQLVSYRKEGKSTGMLAEAMQYRPDTTEETGTNWFLHTLDTQEEQEFSAEKFAHSPMIVVLSTDSELVPDWLKAGRSLQRLLLTAADQGLTHCISAAPVEIPTLAPSLRRLSGLASKPQALFRIGEPETADFTVSSPRRTVSEIIF